MASIVFFYLFYKRDTVLSIHSVGLTYKLAGCVCSLIHWVVATFAKSGVDHIIQRWEEAALSFW